MAQVILPDLTLISEVTDPVNIVVDDGVQSYRATMPQVFNYLVPKLSESRVISAAGNAITSADKVVLLDPTSSSFSQDLPALETMPVDFVIYFKNIATNGNTVTLDPDGSEQIDRVSTLVLGSDPVMDGVLLFRTETRWLIL